MKLPIATGDDTVMATLDLMPLRSRMPRRALPLFLVAAITVSTVGACGTSEPAASGGDTGSPTGPTTGPLTAEREADTSTTTDPRAGTATEPAATGPTTTRPAGQPDPPVPTLAQDPAGLADQVVAAERAVRDPATPSDVLARQAHTQQTAYRLLSIRPEWDAEVLAVVPDDLRPAVQANIDARREFLGMRDTLATEVPAWRIVEPAPADELLAHYQEAEAATGVGWEYLAAINLVETGMGRIQGVSTAGAQGPMQFLPSTWEAWGQGTDINDPRDAILAAGRYLADKGAPEDMSAAVFAYNRHANYVRAVLGYAGIMEADPSTFRGFYHWQIHYLSDVGDLLLPVGYEQPAPIPAAQYLATNPDHLAGPVPPGF